MWTTIAMWGGVAGLFVSIFAVIIIYLTRKNILDILDKDVILFSRNFELKKTAIENSFKLADEIQEKGEQIVSNLEFNQRAKTVYNELLCVVSDARVADEFYNLAIENTLPITESRIAQFKLHCRKDIGLSVKNSNGIKKNAKHKDGNIRQDSNYGIDIGSGNNVRVQYAKNNNQNRDLQSQPSNQMPQNAQNINQNDQSRMSTNANYQNSNPQTATRPVNPQTARPVNPQMASRPTTQTRPAQGTRANPNVPPENPDKK